MSAVNGSSVVGGRSIGLLVALTALIAGVAYAMTSTTPAPSAVAPARKCVGMFAGVERRNIGADSKSLTVVGTVPCREEVMVWATQGVYRAFDDGSVEVLAVPTPPCPGGDAYVWIRYPNPQ